MMTSSPEDSLSIASDTEQKARAYSTVDSIANSKNEGEHLIAIVKHANHIHRPKAWVAVFGGILIHLSIGSYFTFGNMNPYITSYIRVYGEQTNLTYGTSVWIYTALIIGLAVAKVFGGYLGRRIGCRLTVLLGSVISSSGVALTYYTCHDVRLMVLTYGLMVGLGNGIIYINPILNAMKWLPNHKGLASGIVVAGFGASSSIFTQVQTLYINPDNLVPNVKGGANDSCQEDELYFNDASLLQRAPVLYLTLGGIYFGLQLSGCLLLLTPPPEEEPSQEKSQDVESQLTSPKYQIDCTMLCYTWQLGEIPVTSHDSSADASGLFGRSLRPMEAMRTLIFPVLWLTFLFNGQAVVYVINIYKTFGQTFIADDGFLAMVGTVSSLANMASRIFWGAVVDKYSYKSTNLILSSVCTVLLITFYFSTSLGKVAYLLWVSALFFSIGGNYTLRPLVTATTFGPKYAGQIYGLLFSSQILGSIVATTVLSQHTCNIGYGGILALCGGLQFASVVLTLLYPASN
eukprot:scpid67080/ scgid35148/ Oxalate:formate antiporter; Oxalate:formate antiport protein; Oxalate:formate exchange protein